MTGGDGYSIVLYSNYCEKRQLESSVIDESPQWWSQWIVIGADNATRPRHVLRQRAKAGDAEAAATTVNLIARDAKCSIFKGKG